MGLGPLAGLYGYQRNSLNLSRRAMLWAMRGWIGPRRGQRLALIPRWWEETGQAFDGGRQVIQGRVGVAVHRQANVRMAGPFLGYLRICPSPGQNRVVAVSPGTALPLPP